MNSFFRRLVVGVLVLSMAMWTVPVKAAIVDEISIPISISATIGSIGTYSLSASPSSATTSDTMSFDTSTVSTSDPWRVIDGYIDIDLSVTGNTTWGLRMVTDNVADLTGIDRDSATGTLYVDANSNGTYDTGEEVSGTGGGYSDGTSYFAGFDTTGTGTYSYSGLINTAYMDDSSMRAAFAWQVDGYDTDGASTIATLPSAPTADGAHSDSSSVGDWNDPWVYMVDKSNSDYGDNGWNTATGGEVSQDTDSDGALEFNYSLIAYGSVSGGYLALKDTARPLSSTEGSSITDPWDIYVYLVGKFMNTDWNSGTDFVLPAGSYDTNLYLELFTE